MKKLLALLSFIFSTSSFADENLIEFYFSQSSVLYQLNKNSGSLFGIIKDLPNGICLHQMDFKSKSKSNSVFSYELNDNDRGRSYYQRLDINLLTNQANVYSSARNIVSSIPITTKNCSTSSCSNISKIPLCNY